VSSQEVPLWVEAVFQVMVQAVRLIYDQINYTRYEYGSCVYFKQRNDDLTYLLLYVYDMMIVAINKTQIQNFKAQLKQAFDIKDLREAKKI